MAGPLADGRFRFLGAHSGLHDVHQRIAYEFYGSPGGFVHLRRKGVDAGHFRSQVGHHLRPAPAPGPGRGRNIGKYGNVEFFGHLGHPHIEVRIIHGDEHVRLLLYHDLPEQVPEGKEPWQLAHHLYETHDAVIFIIKQDLASSLGQSLPAHAEHPGRRVLLQDSLSQSGCVEIPGGFPRRNENLFHPVLSSLFTHKGTVYFNLYESKIQQIVEKASKNAAVRGFYFSFKLKIHHIFINIFAVFLPSEKEKTVISDGLPAYFHYSFSLSQDLLLLAQTKSRKLIHQSRQE